MALARESGDAPDHETLSIVPGCGIVNSGIRNTSGPGPGTSELIHRHFFRVAAEAIRQILIDRERLHRRADMAAALLGRTITLVT